MYKRLTGALLAAFLVAGGAVGAASPASAVSMSASGKSCTVTVSKGSKYVGSVIQGWAKVVNGNCKYVQAEIKYNITGNGQCSLKTSLGSKTTGASDVYAANNYVAERAAHIWVTSSSKVKYTY